MHCRFAESIRGSDVFLIQSHSGPVNDSIMEQLIMVDAAKRASAKRITAVPVLAECLAQELAGEAVTVVAPDAGGGKLARRFADRLNAEIAFIDKRRPKGTHNVAVATEVVGEIHGRTCLIVDDIIDTAGTVVSAADLLLERGASDVLIAATHGLLSGPAVDRLKNARIREVVVTNTVPVADDKRFDNLRVLSIAPLLAETIQAVFEDRSVSELLGGDNV